MSHAVTTAAPQSSPRRQTAQNKPKLRLVVPEIAEARSSFPLICIATVVVGLALILVTNIFINHSTYRVQELTVERDQLTDDRDRLAEDLSYRMSPQNVEDTAKAQGMKPAESVKFIREDGTIVDAPKGEGKAPEAQVPGPRKDARDDIKPNLKSDEKLPVVGGSSGTLTPPKLQEPKEPADK